MRILVAHIPITGNTGALSIPKILSSDIAMSCFNVTKEQAETPTVPPTLLCPVKQIYFGPGSTGFPG
ncbi:MAG: hypothetical protein GXO82_05090 [Chlorobi bacterium]|nr:hypothetical protein [Chlorobiota bacterium]